MADEKESKKEESGRNTALLRLPFGLCKRYGIAIQDSWTPRDAWNALKGRRGIDPREAMDDYLDDRDADKPSTAARKVISLQEAALKYLKDKGISRYDKTPANTDSWAEKKYYELMNKYDNGEKPELRLNGTLKQRLLSFIENRQVSSAKRILRLDSDADTSAEQKYWDRQTELIKSLSTTTPKNKLENSTATKKNKPEKSKEESELDELAKKIAEAKAYFREYMERKNKLQAEGKYEEREITTSTYERALKRVEREIARWMGRG